MRTTTLLAILVLGCGPKPTDTHPIAGGNESQRGAVKEAVTVVEEVWRSPAFWRLVEERMWIPGPGQTPVSGTAVRAALEPHSPAAQKYRLVAFYGRNIFTAIYTSANAETTTCETIDILRRRVPRDSLVNTVAHENTHLVTAADCKTTYIDDGYSDTDLPWLVSYGIGDLAQCFASSGGDPARTTQCFDQTVNAASTCRAYAECCLEGASTAVKAARAGSARCTTGCAAIQEQCAWAGYSIRG